MGMPRWANVALQEATSTAIRKSEGIDRDESMDFILVNP